MLMAWKMQMSSACVAAEQVAKGADQEMSLLQPTAAAKQAEHSEQRRLVKQRMAAR